MNHDCINVDDWHKLMDATKGSRVKQWIVDPFKSAGLPGIFLYKESHKNYPAEFWAEIVACQIGEIIGIPTPETCCAQMGEKYAALIKFFLKGKLDKKDGKYQTVETLIHGGDIILDYDPAFDRKKGAKHNIFLVEKIFLDIKQENLFNQFLKILIFDTIIGNTDRHQDNWGFIRENETGKIHLTPAFDNSTSLGSELLEKNLAGYLEDNALKLEQYIKKGKAHIRWSEDGNELFRITHFDLLKNIARNRKNIVDYIKELTSFSDMQIKDLLAKLTQISITNSTYRLSNTRKELMFKIISLRRDLLKREFELI